MAERISVIYDLDDDGESTGVVHAYCSDECMREAYTGRNQACGWNRRDEFNFVPQCETCGRPVAKE